jgi:mannose-6-phosphate isomerase-like protein (cupin superfamily)
MIDTGEFQGGGIRVFSGGFRPYERWRERRFLSRHVELHERREYTMIIRDSVTCPHTRVLDRSILCELLHPDKVAGTGGLDCSIAHAIVPSGESTLSHRLHRSTEIYYILEGTGEIHIGGEISVVVPGQIVLIPPGTAQYIVNTGAGDLVFLCIVSPKWQAEDETLA